MDDGMINYTEYSVDKKSTSKDTVRRLLLTMAWWMLPVMIIIVGLASTATTWVVFLFPIGMIIAIPFSRHTYKSSFIEYEYALVAGVMRFAIVNGAMKRKEWFEAKLGDMTMIAPYEGEYKTKADAMKPDITYEAISSFDSPDVYCGVYRNEDGKDCMVYFEATAKLLKLAKFYNRNIVIKEVRY